MSDFFQRVGIIYTVLASLILLVELFFAFLVLNHDSRDKRNRVFFVFAISMASFLVTNYLADGLTSPAAALIDLRLYFVSTAVLTSSIFYFALIFPRDIGRGLWLRYLLVAYGIISTALSLSPLLVRNVTIESWGSNVVGGNLFMPYNMFNLLLLVGILVTLLIGLFRSKGQARKQMFYLSCGFFLFFITNLVVNVILPIATNTNQYARYGSYASAFFVFFTAYAIVAHKLFDIKLIIRRTVVYSGLLVFILGVYSVIVFSFTALLGTGNAFDGRTIAPNLLAAVLIAAGFEPLRQLLQRTTEKYLFKKEYEEQIVLRNLTQKLNNVIDLDEALEIMMQTIVKTLHVHHAITFILQNIENNELAIKRIKQIGYDKSTSIASNDKQLTLNYFVTHTDILLVNNLEDEVQEEKNRFENLHKAKKSSAALINKETASQEIRAHAVKQSFLRQLQNMEAEVVIPLLLNGQIIGLILLSRKLSGDTFFKEDLTLLETVGAQAISSIQKAKLFEGDQMKSEFVSIASHELLTPISAIEGYLSMILDENIGKVDPQAREYLNKVYTSAKRLSTLIKDLLSVSRIESGKLNIEAQSLDMAKMIQDTIDQLKFVAQDKGIALTFNKPYKEIAPVWADPDRTTQVLVNLVSNAIKYTPQGSVTITMVQILHPKPMVKIDITDTGLGMNKEQQSHLFEKFYRVDSPQTTGIIGTGLGLYITRSIMERMGGSISLKSASGAGSTFTITLPIFQVENTPAE